MQSLPTAASRAETLLKAIGVAFGFGIFLALAIDGGVSQAEDDSPNRPQDARRSGSAHPALVFPQGDIQTMVQAAFHDPVASLDREHPLGLELFEG